MSILGAILKGKKVGQKLLRSTKTDTIKFKPSVKTTGTKSLIDKYKKAVEKVKSSPHVIEKKKQAVGEIHGFVKKHGGTKADEAAGAKLKGGK